MGESLNPSLPSRLAQAIRPDWSRTVRARRFAAGVLVLLAGIAAVRADPAVDQVDVVVASRDLQPGAPLTHDDVHMATRSSAHVPDGAPTTLDDVVDSILAGPTRRGEIVTDIRLIGPRLAESTAGPNARLVPLRLNDSALLELIRAGDVVDVLAAGPTGAAADADGRARVVARGAVVVLISPTPTQRGTGNQRVVLVALPARAAHTVAGVALVETVTLTIH